MPARRPAPLPPGVHLRRDGRYEGRLSLGRDPATGAYRRESVYAATPEDCAAALERRRRAVTAGAGFDSERGTVADYLAYWLDELVDIDPHTHLRYEADVRLRLVPHLGSVRLAGLRAEHIRLMLNRLVVEPRPPGRWPSRQPGPRPPVSARTIAHCYDVLRAALNAAVKLEIIDRNVALLVDPPRPARVEVEPFSTADARRLLAATRDHRLAALISVALALGLRQGEAIGLRWDDVDLDAGRLTIAWQVQRLPRPDGPDPDTGATTSFQFRRPKGKRSRTILLPPELIAQVRDHRDRLAQERRWATRWEDWGLVFPSRVGRPLEASNLLRTFDNELAKSGLRAARFHDLRHTSAALLLAQGVPMQVVQAILGHQEMSTTANIYAHLLEEARQDAATRMDGWLVAANDEPVPLGAGDRRGHNRRKA